MGYDLLFEWLIGVRHKPLINEYGAVLGTFSFGENIFWDFIGVFIAISSIFVTVSMTSSLSKVTKCSLAVWKPDDWKILQNQGYYP